MSNWIRCELGGGLILLDESRLDQWEHSEGEANFEPIEEFSIALDVEGTTDIVYDYPGESWEDVWRRETQGIVSRINAGEMAVLILPEGDFAVDLNIDGELTKTHTIRYCESEIQISSGKLIIAELGRLIENLGLDRKYLRADEDWFTYQEIELCPGTYAVRFGVQTRFEGVNPRSELYGKEEDPAIFVRMSPTANRHSQIKELPRFIP